MRGGDYYPIPRKGLQVPSPLFDLELKMRYFALLLPLTKSLTMNKSKFACLNYGKGKIKHLLGSFCNRFISTF